MRICLACGSSIALDKGPCPVCASPGSPPSEPLPRVGAPLLRQEPRPTAVPPPAAAALPPQATATPQPVAAPAPPVAAPAPMPVTPQGYRPPPGPVTEAVASVARPQTRGGPRSGSRRLLVVLAVLAVVLAGAIVKLGWFSSSASSASVSAAPGGGASGGATGAGATVSASGKPASVAPTNAASTAGAGGAMGTDAVGGVVAAVSLVQADYAVERRVAPVVSVALVRTLVTYAGGINAKDLTAAYAAYSPNQRARSPFPVWSRGVAGSRLSTVRIVSAVGAITSLGSGPVTIDVTFTSHQPASQGPVAGQTCTDWALQYTLVPDAAGSGYLIDSARPSAGSGHTACRS